MSTPWGPPPGAPVTAGRHASGPSRAPVVGAVAVLVVLALTSALAMARPDASPRHPAAALVGADGARSVLTLAQGGGSVLTVETARQPGGAALQGGPEEFLEVFGVAGEAALSTSWVRETQQRRRDGQSTGTETLRSLDAEGLRSWVEVTDRGTRVFDPPALTLPADVGPGESWSSSGTVSDPGDPDDPDEPDEPAAYLLEATAAAATSEPGCLEVSSSLRVGGGGAEDAVRTWCPGRGVVAQQLPGEGWTATDRPVAELLGGSVPATAVPEPGWSPTGWSLRPTPLRRGGEVVPVVLGRAPALLGDDTPVLAPSAGGDLVATDVAGGELRRRWTAHPGGVVTAHAGFGELTVAATTLRRLVAYDDTGLPRWTLRLEDVVTRALLVLDDATLVAADQSGTVTAVALADGAVRWRQRLAGDVVVAPVRCGDLVVAADATRQLTALAAATGEQRWSVGMPEDVDLLACDEGTVLVGDAEYDLHALEVADGGTRWTVPRSEPTHQAVVASDVVVLRSGPDVVALRSADAGSAWSAAGQAQALVGSGDQLAVLGPDRLRVLDRSGAEQVVLPGPPGPGTGEVWLSPGTGGLWLVGQDGVPTWAGP